MHRITVENPVKLQCRITSGTVNKLSSICSSFTFDKSNVLTDPNMRLLTLRHAVPVSALTQLSVDKMQSHEIL